MELTDEDKVFLEMEKKYRVMECNRSGWRFLSNSIHGFSLFKNATVRVIIRRKDGVSQRSTFFSPLFFVLFDIVGELSPEMHAFRW